MADALSVSISSLRAIAGRAADAATEAAAAADIAVAGLTKQRSQRKSGKSSIAVRVGKIGRDPTTGVFAGGGPTMKAVRARKARRKLSVG